MFKRIISTVAILGLVLTIVPSSFNPTPSANAAEGVSSLPAPAAIIKKEIPITPSLTSLSLTYAEEAEGLLVAVTGDVEEVPYDSPVAIIDSDTFEVLQVCTSLLDCTVLLPLDEHESIYARSGEIISELLALPYTESPVEKPETQEPETNSLTSYSISLAITNSTFNLSQTVGLTATPSPSVGSGYAVYIFDVTTDTLLNYSYYCVNCNSVNTRFNTGGPHEYAAYIADSSNASTVDDVSDLLDIQATSDSVYATRAAWTVSITTSALGTFSERGNGLVMADFYIDFTSNQNVDLPNSGYRWVLHSITDNRWSVGPSSFGGWTNRQVVEGGANQVVGYVGIPVIVSGVVVGVTDIQATSNLINVDDPKMQPITIAAGSNPSQVCSTACEGDPINTLTQEFFENSTDLKNFSTAGPPLQFIRTYSGMRSNESISGMASGWTHNYNMFITEFEGAASSGGTDLPDLNGITITQENSSIVNFFKDVNGNYYAKNGVKATLEYDPINDEFIFIRDKNSIFVFSGDTGLLIGEKDSNNNSLTLIYDISSHLTDVINDKGQGISLTWTGEAITGVENSAGQEVAYGYSYSGSVTNNLTSVTHVNGEDTLYGYSSHRITTITRPNGGIVTNTYSGSTTKVTSQEDELGNLTTFSFSSNVATVTYANGMVKKQTYSNGRLTEEISAYGTAEAITTSFAYDADGNITQRTNPDTSTVEYTYDDSGNILTYTDELNRTTTLTYNILNKPLTIIDPSGRATIFTYDVDGNTLTLEDGEENIINYTHNSDGTVSSIVAPSGAEIEYGYNVDGFLISVTNDLDEETDFIVNDLGLPIETTDANNNSTYANYDDMGQVLSRTDAQGSETIFEYDEMGRLVSTTDEDLNTNLIEYDLFGNIIKKTDANSVEEIFEYDEMNRVLRDSYLGSGKNRYFAYDLLGRMIIKSPAPNFYIPTNYEYNWRGQLTKTTLPEGGEYVTNYDAAGQVVSTQLPDLTSTTYTYTSSGEVASITDAEGRINSFEYDENGRVTVLTRPDLNIETIGYDEDGNKISYTDADANISTYAYDSARRLISTSEYNIEKTYNYDSVGNLIKIKDLADDSFVEYEYDSRNSIVSISSSDINVNDIDFTYNDLNQKETMSDSNGTTTYSYTPTGQLSLVDNSVDGAVEYGYTNLGDVNYIEYPNGNEVFYQYDYVVTEGAIRQVSESTSGLYYSISLNGDGIPEASSIYNGTPIFTNYTYDVNNNLEGIIVNTGMDDNPYLGPVIEILNINYNYDDTGLITLKDSVTPTDSSSTEYSYDSLSRMNQLTTDTITTGDYVFDDINNITGNPYGDTFTYNSSNEVTNRSNSSATDIDYTYDLRGNRVSQDVITGSEDSSDYVYNGANQLTNVAIDSAPYSTDISYSYDGNGLRNEKTKTVNSVTTTNKYIWDTNTSVPKLLENSNTVYIYGAGSAPIAQINKSTGDITFLFTDKIGSVRITTDTTGAVTSELEYDEYGTIISGAPLSAFGFAGEYKDADTDFYYLRSRWYDPSTAQFISVDPILNKTHLAYGYTQGNPLSYTDPTGLITSPPQPVGGWSITDALTAWISGAYHTELCNRVVWATSYSYVENWVVADSSEITAIEAMSIFKENPGKIFPFEIDNCNELKSGNICTLHAFKGTQYGWANDLLNGNGDVYVSTTPNSVSFTVVSDGYFDPKGSQVTFSTRTENGKIILTQTASAQNAFIPVRLGIWAGQSRALWEEQADNLSEMIKND